MVFINSPINFSPPLRMTINVPPIMTPFLPIVILNERKNALWEKREAATWHRVKNLWLWWHLTTFLTTVTDPSLSLQDDVLWSSTSLRGDAYRQSSFWTVARMLCGKNGKRNDDTEWRIYDSDDILPLSSLQVQILHIRFGWRLTFPSLQQTNPLLMFRMTPNGNHMLRLLTHS